MQIGIVDPSVEVVITVRDGALVVHVESKCAFGAIVRLTAWELDGGSSEFLVNMLLILIAFDCDFRLPLYIVVCLL
ncbi:hypothetical protein RYX36_022053 [Vicia faba]